jgi:tocopherol cyclase
MRHPFRSYRYQGPRFASPGSPTRSKEYFEGWYFKLALSDGRVLAFIPGVSLGADAHAFVQVNDSLQGSAYVRFPLSDAGITRDAFAVSIGPNRFDLSGIELDLDAGETRYRGRIDFSGMKMLKPGLFRPGIMGPFSYIPGMECYHGLVSMHHRLAGSLQIDGEQISTVDGRGYIEKDWGRSFPRAWIWMQANSFPDEASFMFSYAHIPWGKRSFPGHLGFLYHRDILPEPLVFASYSSIALRRAELREDGDSPAVLAGFDGRGYSLEIEAWGDGSRDLLAPRLGRMDRVIKETVAGSVRCRLSRKGTLLWEQVSPAAGLEIQGPVKDLLLDPLS